MRWEKLSPGSGHSRADTALPDAETVTARTFGTPGSHGACLPRRPIHVEWFLMVSAPQADRVWKNMTASIIDRDDHGQQPAVPRAGAAAYCALLQGGGTGSADGAPAKQWLLLRKRTTERLKDR